MRLGALGILIVTAAAARASDVREDATVNTIQPTAANPRSSSFTDSLNGTIDLSSRWVLDLGASLTLQGRTPASERGQFPESGSVVALFTSGVEWTATDNLTLGTELQASPRSTQFAGTTVALRQANGSETSADVLLRSQTSQVGASLNLSWDSTGESDLEWSYGATLDYTHYGIEQGVPLVRLADGTTVSSTTLRQETVAYCQAHPRVAGCGQALLTALAGTPATLDSARVSADVTATVFATTDLTLSAAWYFYGGDPSQVGYFSLVAAGRSAGIPIAPLQYEVRPEAVHRFGDFSARLWLQAGQYVQGTGQSTAGAGLKLQYKFTRALRSWLAVSGQRDVDQTDQVTRTVSTSAGAAWRF